MCVCVWGGRNVRIHSRVVAERLGILFRHRSDDDHGVEWTSGHFVLDSAFLARAFTRKGCIIYIFYYVFQDILTADDSRTLIRDLSLVARSFPLLAPCSDISQFYKF